MSVSNLSCAVRWCSLLGILISCTSQAQLYSLADDWSDVNNPNGAWALYKAPNVLFNTVQSDWYNNGSNPKQPAWADAPGPDPFPPNPLVPMWAKAVGDVGTLSGGNYDGLVDIGTIFMHSAEEFRTGTDFSSVVWTSPRSGTIHIDGGVWMAQAFTDRPHQWELRKNGGIITGGSLTYGDGYDKSNPFLFSTGYGGASAIDLNVVQSDQMELLIYKTGGFFAPGTLVGVDLSIDLVPEPSMLVLLVSSGLPALWRQASIDTPFKVSTPGPNPMCKWPTLAAYVEIDQIPRRMNRKGVSQSGRFLAPLTDVELSPVFCRQLTNIRRPALGPI